MKKRFQYLGQGIEELILISIIILHVLDFLELLGPTWDYAKKILSWTALGYLLYKASLTDLFFGTKKKHIDFMLIITFFLLSFKNFIGYANSTISNFASRGLTYWADRYNVSLAELPSSYDLITISLNQTADKIQGLAHLPTILPFSENPVNTIILNISTSLGYELIEIDTKYSIHRWLNFVIDNKEAIYNFSLIISAVSLFLIALYCASKIKIKAPSIMHMITHKEDKEGESITAKQLFIRTFLIFLVFNAFFIIIFNLVMEWLAIAIDAPLLIVGLFFYLLIWIKHHKRFSSESLIYKLGNLGNEFYENFISLLKTRKGLLLGISGMLVLHLLTDIGIFIIPYTTGLHDPLYFDQLQGNHEPIFSIADLAGNSEGLFAQDFSATAGISEKFYLTYAYLMNHIFLILILGLPAALWYLIFMSRRLDPRPWFLSLFLGSMVCFLMAPSFSIKRILESGSNLAGVDIQTNSILQSTAFNLNAVFITSIAIGFLVYLACKNLRLRELITQGTIIIILFTFAWYVYLFFLDLTQYYIALIYATALHGLWFNAAYFMVFFGMTILFYVGGFVSYLYEIVHN